MPDDAEYEMNFPLHIINWNGWMELQGERETGLTVAIDRHVATIRIDRPAKKNAMTAAMWEHVVALLSLLAEHGDIRVIILCGAGADFSAGADIAEFETVRRDSTTARAYEDLNARAFAALRDIPIPTIAAIRGACHGGGFGLAASCDLRVATADARFSVPAARLGLAYPATSMETIVWALGAQMARYLTFSGAQIDAHAAMKAGFLLDVVADDALDDHVDKLARRIADNAPLSVSASKAAIGAALTRDPQALAAAEALGTATFDSADYAEGRAAFKKRRAPVFSGR